MIQERKPVRTTCPYCGVGCGVIATVNRDGSVGIKGDLRHPASFGRLCAKGLALNETLDLHGRLLYPEVYGQRVSWDLALDVVSSGIRRTIKTHGPHAVAFYVSGQLLTEDYYCANKLMKGFIGSANIDTNSRLCMSSAVAGYQRAFGSDSVPCSYEDLELADLVVLVGSNTVWCHPVLYQRILEVKKGRPSHKLVVIDPRRTATCEYADLHLPIRPGTDAWLFNGLLSHLWHDQAFDWAFIEAHTEGYNEALGAALECAGSVSTVARRCGLTEEAVTEFFRLFANTERGVTLFSQGINQSSSGTDKVNSIINCHLATGRIGRPGMGPFSITGQPNAMGGREVGGLATQLAAHMGFKSPEDVNRVARFWHAPSIATKPGLKAVELFEAVNRGEIRVIWIMATNPVVSLPDADHARTALRKCELVIVSDCMRYTDTTILADVLLPALAWGEKDGTVTNSERRISRQHPFLPWPGEARPDWWVITQVAHRLGFAEYFPYEHPADIFREHASLSGYENHGTRAFDISALSEITNAEYDALPPQQWPIPKGYAEGTKRLFADRRFFHPSGKARMIPVIPRAPVRARSLTYPLVLNTGRVRDHWHTLTRTGKSPRLSAHVVEPFVEMHPDDAREHGVSDSQLIRIRSRWGEVTARAHVTEDQQPGCLFIPMHWNDQFASKARIGGVVNPICDPVSGQPESKHTPVYIAPCEPAWEGFLITRATLAGPPPTSYWTLAIGPGCWRYEIAGDEVPEDWEAWARTILGADRNSGDWFDYSDRSTGVYRAARIAEGRLGACLFIAPRYVELPGREWLISLFPLAVIEPALHTFILAGTPARDQDEVGLLVCSCFSVGRSAILTTIEQKGLQTVEALGQALRAGTRCGSCIPELEALIRLHKQKLRVLCEGVFRGT